MSIPGAGNPLLLGGAAGGYEIERSLRFNSADSAYLSRTPASAGNRKTWTWAGWVKRSALNATNSAQCMFAAGANSTNFMEIRLSATIPLVYDTLNVTFVSGASDTARVSAERLFRDVSAWYHIVVAVDTTQTIAANRVKIYVNGSETGYAETLYPSQNSDWFINSAVAHAVGRNPATAGRYFDGYLADIHFIDGQALDPTSFGEFDTNGVWQPKTYTGTYGTNGFHLDFADNSTAAALGYDAAGSNDWTVNNLSVAAGAGNDSLVDTPTNYGTDTGAGGEVRGNYCTWNPLDLVSTSVANGNLQASGSTDVAGVSGTIGVSSGKWYWEVTAGSVQDCIGIWPTSSRITGYPGYTSDSYGYYGSTGNKINSAAAFAYGAAFTANDVIGVALDLDAGTLTFYKNNVSQGTAFTGLSGGYRPAVRAGASPGPSTATYLNAGQRPFAYTAPSGFKALCTTNLPEPTIADGSTAMDVVTYTGNGSTQTISGLGFSPDFVWGKSRLGGNHMLADVIRGATKRLISNLTNAEDTGSALTSFNSDGFSVDFASAINSNGEPVVAWCWDAGSSTVTNNDGTISSQVRANPSAGFSIVTYTGTGSAATVGHGLGVAPAMIITKGRTNTAAWLVYHQSIGATNFVQLNTTIASTASITAWNDTAPTSTVFSIGTSAAGNTSGVNNVAYCFAPVSGYSSFGSYTGNGSADGPFVYTGFRPRWILVKSSTLVNGWVILDAIRDQYNIATKQLIPNLANAELTTEYFWCDILSNGFKLRSTTGVANGSSSGYVYAAFAESPFALARAR